MAQKAEDQTGLTVAKSKQEKAKERPSTVLSGVLAQVQPTSADARQEQPPTAGRARLKYGDPALSDLPVVDFISKRYSTEIAAGNFTIGNLQDDDFLAFQTLDSRRQCLISRRRFPEAVRFGRDTSLTFALLEQLGQPINRPRIDIAQNKTAEAPQPPRRQDDQPETYSYRHNKQESVTAYLRRVHGTAIADGALTGGELDKRDHSAFQALYAVHFHLKKKFGSFPKGVELRRLEPITTALLDHIDGLKSERAKPAAKAVAETLRSNPTSGGIQTVYAP